MPNFDAKRVDDLIVGNAVPEAEQGMQMARMISFCHCLLKYLVLQSTDIADQGLEAIALASARVHAGTADCIIAGGTESNEYGPSNGNKTALNYKSGDRVSRLLLSMGLTAEQVAKEFNINRDEADQFALESHQKR